MPKEKEEISEEVKEKPDMKARGCSSVNRHAFLTDSEGVKIPNPKTCSLPTGHDGNHKAVFLTGKKNRKGEPEEKESFWSSGAEIEINLD